MHGIPRFGQTLVVCFFLLPSVAGAGSSGLLVQQIGDLRSNVADTVASQVTIVPFSPRLDPRTTPIILATGKAFVRPGEGVGGLQAAERRAIRQAYDAGQVILLLDASTHDIEALHLLLADGITHQSATDPVILAYALRQENGVPLARLVTHPATGDATDEDDSSLSQALEIVIEELTRPSLVAEDLAFVGESPNWGASPVQKFILTSTTTGIYNTPVDIYALHACDENMDYYLVNTGGDWTATQARYESAETNSSRSEIRATPQGTLTVDWEETDAHCSGGVDILIDEERICRYANYPLSYEIDILPPSGPTVVQVNAAPAGDQGLSASYESGFSFSIAGEVEVSGDGPSGGLQAGVSWDNTVSIEVPPLAIDAGIKGNQGTFTTYRYCTAGSDPNCTSTIQMTGAEGLCRGFVVGQPQNGQTPNGRLSDVAQTVYWRVDPGTYTGATFDITVTWTVELATSTSYLWTGVFENLPETPYVGPTGMCNVFGCSCSISTATAPITVSHTFQVPRPSSSQCPS